MPFVDIKVIEGVFTSAQKRELIQRVTDAVVSVEGERLRPLTLVLIEESVKSADWGIGGHCATVEDVKAIQEGRAKAPAAA